MRIDDLHKRCPKCGEVKALADFPPSKKRSQGVKWYCRPCIAKANFDRLRRKAVAEGAHDLALRRAAEDLREARALQGDDPW